MNDHTKAMRPEDVTRLVAERLNAGDAAGAAALYDPQAVLAYPADRPVTGRDAIQAIYQRLADAGMSSRSSPRCPPSRSRTWRLPRPARRTTPASASRSCAASPTAPGCESSTVPRSPHRSPPSRPPLRLAQDTDLGLAAVGVAEEHLLWIALVEAGQYPAEVPPFAAQ